MASRVKSLSFKQSEEPILDFADNKAKTQYNGDFSEYIKDLIKKDMETGYKPSKELEEYIIKMIKKYAPGAKEEDIKNDFDEDAVAALSQFDEMD